MQEVPEEPQGWVNSDGMHRLDPRRILSRLGSIHRDNPDETPLWEAVDLIRRFKRESEQSELRRKALRWWRECDRFLEGDQWDADILKQLSPWQARLTINKLHKVREKWTSLLMSSIPKVEFVPRDASKTMVSDAIDGFFAHEWERNSWQTTVGIVLKQAVSHGIGWIKVYWDVHGDGGRGTVKLEPVSNYDLFLDEGAVIRDGRLVCKYAIHRFEMTRNQILSIYGEDPGGALRSDSTDGDQVEVGTSHPPRSKFFRYIDDMNVGGSVRGSSGGSGGEDTTERHPDYSKRKEVYTVNECLYFDDSRVEGPEVDEAFTGVPPLNYPNGRIMTECNGMLLYDDANRLGFNMYVPLCLSPDIERIYNPSIIYHCISPQKELNKRRSQIADHAAMAGNPIMVISQAAQIDQSFVPYPGAVMVSMDAESVDGGIRWLQPPSLSSEVIQSAMAADADINIISGIEEVSWGRAPNQLESGVALDHLQKASETIPQMHNMFFDDGYKTLCRNIVSLFLDFVEDERKYRFLDTKTLEQQEGSFDPVNLLLPSREIGVRLIQEEIAMFKQQLQEAEMLMSPEELETFVPHVLEEIADRELQIEQIWQLPASDLISFDVVLQTGTRDMTKAAVQAMAMQMFELGGITLPTLMEVLKFPNWLEAYQLKQEELAAAAQDEKQTFEDQLEIQREIDEDEHEQDLEIERTKGDFRLREAEIRAAAQRAVSEQRARQASRNRSKNKKRS